MHHRLPLIATILTLTLLAGCASLNDDETTQQATLTIDYHDALDQEPTQHTITYNPDEKPTLDLYETTNTDRPDAYTVHDLLNDWSTHTNTPVTIEHTDTLGFQLQAIDGTPPNPDASYWTLTIDGEPETAAIGTLPVEPDTEYRFTYTPIDDPDAQAHQATVIIDYNGFRSDDPQQTMHTVLYDPTTQPTNDLYESTNTDRPGEYIAHDLLEDWAHLTGTNYTTQPHDDFGFQLESIDTLTAHTTQGGSWSWDLYVNGEHETASIATVPIQENATYEWRFTHASNE